MFFISCFGEPSIEEIDAQLARWHWSGWRLALSETFYLHGQAGQFDTQLWLQEPPGVGDVVSLRTMSYRISSKGYWVTSVIHSSDSQKTTEEYYDLSGRLFCVDWTFITEHALAAPDYEEPVPVRAFRRLYFARDGHLREQRQHVFRLDTPIALNVSFMDQDIEYHLNFEDHPINVVRKKYIGSSSRR